ncbi:uncharacterized protein MAM_01056 [Metarhizium album ARSEF 1941]|uniref:Uncharacterized protein n=1 Tax=Metarhizium album (strain ARSEF 1941) TaxID=1081103 RepID=A0A0B2X905_METAS|nr:uncharacterized protein MAM_01056 [Metarhizium album ARSEF 1941]KHO02055.1 hypothetical protein MAM_01056 [Metarhizium album ARSEF 1941]
MADCPTGGCSIPLTTRAEKRNAYERDPQKAREICQGLRDDLFRIGQNYFSRTYDLASIEGFLHDAWDEFIYAAKMQPADSAEIDRLVTLILEVRELGAFRPTEQDAVDQSKRSEEAVTMSNGQWLWTDLPYLADDLYDFWVTESAALTGPERASLAAFTGKLCAVGVGAPQLSRCALWLFVRALETELPPETLADLLPACREWLRYSKTKLVKMASDNYCPPPPAEGEDDATLYAVGPLVADADMPPGFSIARWLSWRKRAGDIYSAGSGDVSKLGRACFEEMMNAGQFVGIDVPAEKVYLERVFKALEDELASGRFTGCVGVEDIEIDPDWAKET